MTKLEAIRKFFSEGPSGRKVEMTELKALSTEEREELGRLALEALGEQEK